MIRRTVASTAALAIRTEGRSKWRTIYSRWFESTGTLLHQFSRYVLVGGLAFLIDLGSLYSLTEFAGFHYLISAAVAFLLGLLTNYCLCRLWVFDRRTIESATLEFLIFTVIGIVGLGLNEVILWFVGEVIHLHYLIGKVISAGIVLVWNFGVRKFILFR